jgi:UPF0176 protein
LYTNFGEYILIAYNNSDVGHFDHAIKMNVDTFRDGIQLLDELVETKSKDQDIFMYCTGGIRCSVAGSYLTKKGYQNIKMVILN